MKHRVALAVALTICAGAQAQNQPALTPGQTHQRTCILEAALLEKVASMRDLGVARADAARQIMQDATRGTSYSKAFVSDLPQRTTWIYDNGWVDQNGVRMGYLKQCDPKDFNWY